MSLVYLVLLLAVGAVFVFVVGDAVLSVSRPAQWQTPQARLAAEGATLHHLPKKTVPAAAVPAPVAAVAPDVRAREALAA